MAQIVYYFYAAVRLGAPERPVAFSVPTGNFGDVFAGYVAAKMGLPVARLIVATNVNDILHRALTSGDYSVGEVSQTHAPSMDIQVSSNFERLLYDMHGRNGTKLAQIMADFEATKHMAIPAEQLVIAGQLFASARVDADLMSLAMRTAFETSGELLDPHTAIGYAAARAVGLPDNVPVVTLATAHPAKFRDAVERAIGQRPPQPAKIRGLFDREERCVSLPAALGPIEDYISAHAKAVA
jgi:threonine synthase